MVLTSDQIMQQTQMAQQQTILNMQQSSMVSQYAGLGIGGGQQQLAGNIAGSAMNYGAAIGAPVAALGAAAMGFDPVSIGMKAAWGARGAGFMAAGGAGAIAGGAMAVPFMAAQYAGHHAFMGMQQQQQLESQMGAVYQFGNQYGGRGFATREMGDIGQAMRGMTSVRGPGGEFSTMDEMGRLAATMGRMGMAQGVRNAKEFNDKFQEMMKTVTSIATEMSTSLEQAQRLMSTARVTGVFGKSDQFRMLREMNQGAIGGGLALDEVSQMASIGSSVSRAIGGRGRAGAFAGISAITKVGNALQTGILSEENVYDATGQTGAAGRQSMASAMLETDARFFRGGLGRRVLASIAGKDGRINQEDVEEYLNGNVSTGRTMQMAGRNLAKVGRANFIRNEGKLRGEALEAFGGLGAATVASQWLKDRGFDLNNMEDREMIFFQRRFGIDGDQAKNMLRMLRGRDVMRNRQESTLSSDRLLKQLEVQNRFTGMEGFKRKFEDFRHHINTGLEQVGADVYKEGQNLIEGFLNKLFGGFVATIDRDVGQAARMALAGGALGQDVLSRRFGINMGDRGALRNDLAGGRALFAGTGTGFTTKQFVDLNEGRFKAAGYDISGATSQADLTQRLQGIQAMSNGMYQTDSTAMGLGAALKDVVGTQASMLRGRGADRQAAFMRVLDQMELKDASGIARSIREQYGRANGEERSRIMSSVLRGAGLDTGAGMMEVPDTLGMFSSGKFATTSDRHRAMADYAFGGEGSARDEWQKSRTSMLGNMARRAAASVTFGASELFGVGTSLSRSVEDMSASLLGGSSVIGGARAKEGAMRFLDSEEGRNLLEGVTSSNADVRSATHDRLVSRAQELLQRSDSGTSLNEGELLGVQSALMTERLASLSLKYKGVANIPKRELDAAAREFKGAGVTSGEQFLQRAGAGAKILLQKQNEARAGYFRMARGEGQDAIRSMTKSGLLTGKGIDEKAYASLGRIGDLSELGDTGLPVSAGQRALQAYVDAQANRAMMTVGLGEGADVQNQILERAAQGNLSDTQDILSSMSVKDLASLRDTLRGKGVDSFVRQVGSMRTIKERLGKGGKQGGLAGRVSALSSLLGGDLRTKDLKGKSIEDQVNMFRESLAGGLSAEDFGGAALSDIDSQIRLETDPTKKAALQEQREQILQGAGGRLDDVKESTKRVQAALEKIRSGDVRGGEAMLAKEAQSLQGAGLVAAEKKQDEAAKVNDPSFRKLSELVTNTKDMITAINRSATEIVTAVKGGKKDGPPDPAGGGK